jgi:hypothetical protein
MLSGAERMNQSLEGTGVLHGGTCRVILGSPELESRGTFTLS